MENLRLCDDVIRCVLDFFFFLCKTLTFFWILYKKQFSEREFFEGQQKQQQMIKLVTTNKNTDIKKTIFN